ncbi:rrf2 family protein [Orientia chuto str. Dubai]|uniref:Rrf2 family protein n=1 Tax=Orientia chuto str. Dubai TaxID=1359168 RepID=A0A0F3MP62_9RICK|nr:Rrf2 family transcriptional regulator [Candidatus Orientia mediorientalis]KJV57237.1 rrf2 family protein [Orientia chuto str. Dubai]
MILTTKSKYAVMGVLDIASRESNKPIKLFEIAKRQNIALNYLEQLFNKLKNKGIVKSIKGPNGGYLLNCDIKTTTINDIVFAVEEKIKVTRCNNNNGCLALNARCTAHYLWEGLEQKIKNYFSEISLDDIISGKITAQIKSFRANK